MIQSMIVENPYMLVSTLLTSDREMRCSVKKSFASIDETIY
jgi:hypothetical protein